MSTPITTSDSTYSKIEETFRGLPSFENLTHTGSEWSKNLRARKYLVPNNNRLTKAGMRLYRETSRSDWVTNGSGVPVPHSDFRLAHHVVEENDDSPDSKQHPNQSRVNLLLRDIYLLSAYTENQKVAELRRGDRERGNQLESVHTELKGAYKKWYNHKRDDGWKIRNPTWNVDEKSYNSKLAKSADILSHLVGFPEDDTRVQEEEGRSGVSILATRDSDTNFSRHVSNQDGGNSSSTERLQSTAMHGSAEIGDALSGYGGFVAPRSDGTLTKYDDADDAETEIGSASRSQSLRHKVKGLKKVLGSRREL